MLAIPKAYFLFGALVVFSFLSGGCATGPRYQSTEHSDSARIEGPVTPIQNSENGSCSIDIAEVDGLISGFTASLPGLNWFIPRTQLYVAPGKHTLKVNISEIDTEYGNVGHGRTGAIGDSTAGGRPTITVEFAANHVYRLAAYLRGSTIELILWDETAGVASRFRAESWTMDSNSSYSENIPPVRSR